MKFNHHERLLGNGMSNIVRGIRYALFMSIWGMANNGFTADNSNKAIEERISVTISHKNPNPDPSKGAASVVYMYMDGDDNATNIFQDLGTDVVNAFEGYQYKVLLADENTVAGVDFNQAAQNEADDWYSPSASNFTNTIIDLADAGYMIDIYIIAHGSSGQFATSTEDMTTSYLKGALALENSGYERLPIRMVYQANCFGETMNQAWIGLGAKVVTGSRRVNYYPNQFNKFATEWTSGENFITALNNSDTASSRTASQALMIFQSLGMDPDDWIECSFGQTVLGSNACAESFFSEMYYDWTTAGGNSGKDYMNYSSKKMSKGNIYLSIHSSLDWSN